MSNEKLNQEQTQDQDQGYEDNPLDMRLDKVKTSRFIFLLGFFGIFIFAWAGCYNLYQHKFYSPKKNIIKVNESSKLIPEYK